MVKTRKLIVTPPDLPTVVLNSSLILLSGGKHSGFVLVHGARVDSACSKALRTREITSSSGAPSSLSARIIVSGGVAKVVNGTSKKTIIDVIKTVARFIEHFSFFFVVSHERAFWVRPWHTSNKNGCRAGS